MKEELMIFFISTVLLKVSNQMFMKLLISAWFYACKMVRKTRICVGKYYSIQSVTTLSDMKISYLCEYCLILNLKLCLVHAQKGYAYLKMSAFMLSRFCFSDSVLSSVVYVKEALHIEEMSQINLCLKCQISFQLWISLHYQRKRLG